MSDRDPNFSAVYDAIDREVRRLDNLRAADQRAVEIALAAVNKSDAKLISMLSLLIAAASIAVAVFK